MEEICQMQGNKRVHVNEFGCGNSSIYDDDLKKEMLFFSCTL